MTQAQRILTELRLVGEAGMTPDEIRAVTGSARAAARIAELRADGHQIENVKARTPNGAIVARYVLRESGQLFAAPPTDPRQSSAHYLQGETA